MWSASGFDQFWIGCIRTGLDALDKSKIPGIAGHRNPLLQLVSSNFADYCIPAYFCCDMSSFTKSPYRDDNG
jgi:hypothetical protein